jgi:hypothetical protein
MIREAGSRDYGDIEGREQELPVDRRERLARLLNKPESVAQNYVVQQSDISVPAVRRPKRLTDSARIEKWMASGIWPSRYYD